MSARLIAKGYPARWVSGEIQREVCVLAGWRCEHCGAEFWPGTTLAKEARNADGKPRILTVHHLDGNPANCEWTNLLACCQVCHLHIQAVWRLGSILPASWPQPPTWIAIRKLPYMPNGQLSLWPARTRYTYLGDALTDPRLVGMLCDPVRRADGRCVISLKMATALVEDGLGRKYVVPRRRLRLNNKRGL